MTSDLSSPQRGVAQSIVQSISSRPWSLAAAVLLFLLLFVDMPFEDRFRSLNAFWNLGHIPLFALFARLFFVGNPLLHRYSMPQRLVVCVLASAIVGALVEVLQYGLARNMDMGDVYRDVLGALLGFFFVPLGVTAITAGLLRITVVLLIAVQVQPLVLAMVDEQRARRTFPVLSEFESRAELSRWRGGIKRSLSVGQVYSGDSALRFDTGTEAYSGIALAYFPRDWSGYRQLSLAIFSEQRGLRMTLRIHDQQHLQGPQRYNDRFNRSFTLDKGWNQLTVPLTDVATAPLGRALNLRQIAGLGLFVMRQPQVRTFYLDRVQLQL